MSEQSNNPWDAVARECPRKIMRLLHEAGHYHHGVTDRFPGKILCTHHESEVPEDWQPTQAQLDAEAEGDEA